MKNGIVLLMVLSLFALQNVDGQKDNKKVTLSGFVLDAQNKPVEGALILVDNVKSNRVTNSRGFFKIKIRPDVKTIGAFSFTKGSNQVEWNGSSTIQIVLNWGTSSAEPQPDKSEDNEMVNIGYGKVRKKDLTTATSNINGENDKYGSYSNIYDMIKGELPGVQVVGKKIIIRGISTNSTETDPLLLVNGVAVTTIDNIMPRDVKSISVLKGADASIYGSRSANGVILIDLKNTGDN